MTILNPLQIFIDFMFLINSWVESWPIEIQKLVWYIFNAGMAVLTIFWMLGLLEPRVKVKK